MSDLLGSPGTPVVVTGGASGIGRATCLALAEVGRSVAVWDLNGDGAAAVAKECADAHGVASTHLALDVRDEDAIHAGVEPTLAALGAVGGLVHAAGIPMAAGHPLEAAGFDTVLQIHARAQANLVHAFLPALRDAQPGSAIVGISSIEGLIGHGNIAAYTAAKHAVIGLTRALGHALGAERIRANAVCPGFIDTPMFAPTIANPDVRASYEAQVPMHRLGEPVDIARVIRFLLSDEAGYMTGAAVVIDGGFTAAGGQAFFGSL
jgi:NAD(P)-dependent dehydrogenase (short-subunit alcohol dehydrogenase family)